MVKRIVLFVAAALVCGAGAAACDSSSKQGCSSPVLSLRLRANETDTRESWQRCFRAVAEHPGCCDEIWFSTGCGVPALDWHRARARVIADAISDVSAQGIIPSLQFQATLGHGDNTVSDPQQFERKAWTGWTDSHGTETRFCNCPRQPAFLAYLRDVAAIYAPLHFHAVWIDDDLRIAYHQPAKSVGRLIGCWCETCLRAFNAETGMDWSRTRLAEAVKTDDALAARWRKFSIDGLCLVARTLAEAFHAHAPETMLALQHASGEENVDQARAVLKVLHDASGRPVGCRPGGGEYYDDDPNGILLKSIWTGWFWSRLADLDFVKVATPEIESWPRTYYSRSPQGVLMEGFTALMFGMNAVSFFVSDSAKEDPALYGRTFWKALAEASPVLRAYARTIDGCEAVGFSCAGTPTIGIRRAAIPVLAGRGRSLGVLDAATCALKLQEQTSARIQKLRDDLDRRAGGLAAVVRSPFVGLLQVHVEPCGRLRAVALMNTRISEQGPVELLLRNVPENWKTVQWHEMCRPSRSLALTRTSEGVVVTIPSIGPWNGGFLAGEDGR